VVWSLLLGCFYPTKDTQHVRSTRIAQAGLRIFLKAAGIPWGAGGTPDRVGTHLCARTPEANASFAVNDDIEGENQ